MTNRIRYWLVFNRGGKLNQYGEGLVSIELSLHGRKIYFSTHTYLKPHQWSNGMVVNHALENKLNYTLGKMLIEIEEVELDAILQGRQVTLTYMRNAIRNAVTTTARLKDFTTSVIGRSERKAQTKQSYRTVVNDVDRFRRDARLGDIDYQFLVDYDLWMAERGLKHNTRIGRLRCIRTLISEAIKRDLIKTEDDPFRKFKLKGMVSKKGYLKASEIRRLERRKLLGREAHIRDVFVFACYTGLRYSDLVSLRSRHVHGGWLTKRMTKTNVMIRIPLNQLWHGRPQELLKSYKSIEDFSAIGCNSSSNRILSKIGKDAGISMHLTWHVARHTAATNLLGAGVPLTTVQLVLGHKKLDITRSYAETDLKALQKDIAKAFK